MKPFYIKLISIFIISSLGIIVYSNTFFCSFHFDDIFSIVDNFFIKNIRHPQLIWDFLPRRFIANFSIALNYHFGQLNVFGYHLFNLAVHLGSAILVWWLTLLTFSTPVMKEERIARHASVISLLAALIFVAHPVQTEAVTYITQRSASMATFFYVAALCFYIRSRTGESGGRSYYILALMASILAMFSKETAATLPLMILFYEYCFLNTKRNLNWIYLLPFLLTIFIIPLTISLTENGPARLKWLQSEPGISSYHYLLTQFRVIVTYIRLVFLPVHQNLDYDYPIFNNFFELPVLISFLFLVTILYGAKRLFLKYRLLSFSILWFFLTLMPESSVLSIRDVIFEHRLYLPLVGYCIFLVSSMYYLFGDKHFKTVVKALIVVIACYSVLTYQRNKVWRDELTLWNDTIPKSPHKARPYFNRGTAYSIAGNDTQAMADYDKVLSIDPHYANVYYNLGNMQMKSGNFVQAISDFNRAIGIDPDNARAYNNLGFIYDKQDNLAQAILNYNKSIESFPYNAEVYNNRGYIYSREGNFAQALADYNQAIAMDPGFAQFYNNRAIVYYHFKEYDRALADVHHAEMLKQVPLNTL